MTVTALWPTVLCLGLLMQAPDAPRADAERLARSGQHAEALRRFEAIAEADPRDLDARVWVGRLRLWMGRPREAHAAFRAILAEHPDAVEALVGLGASESALGQVDDAVATLTRAAALAPQDADVLAALARAHRLAGQTTQALREFERASGLRPADPDLRMDVERVRRQWAHSVDVGYFSEDYNGPVSGTGNGDLSASMRIDDRWRALGRVQTQRKFGFTDTRAGGGGEWRARRAMTVTAMALFAGDAQILPTRDLSGEVRYGHGPFEVTGSVRHVTFPDASVWILAPGLTCWIGERWSVGGRFFRAETSYADVRDNRVGANSGMVQTSVNVHPRIWVTAAYARGNETFETLSPDRIGRFGADTVGGAGRVDLPGLTSVSAAVEHQWRHDRNETWMVRVSLGLTQRF